MSEHTHFHSFANGKKTSRSFSEKVHALHVHLCMWKMMSKVWNIRERKSRGSVNASDPWRRKCYEPWQAYIRLDCWLFLSPDRLTVWKRVFLTRLLYIENCQAFPRCLFLSNCFQFKLTWGTDFNLPFRQKWTNGFADDVRILQP